MWKYGVLVRVHVLERSINSVDEEIHFQLNSTNSVPDKLMLFSVRITQQNRNILYGQKTFSVRVGGAYSYHWALNR
jgi:hypothetical protein